MRFGTWNSYMCAKAAGASTLAVPGAAREDVRMAWPDTRLVRECIQGNEEAWSALIDKYKNLIFSIPIKYGFSSDDATDVFQAVCLDLLTELPRLREPKALPKWLMQVTAHKCFHRKRLQLRTESTDEAEEPLEPSVPSCVEEILRQTEEEQSLRVALLTLQPRCRRLIEMLFFEEPPRPYQQVAESLGIATGSIGFIRQRCLDRLRKQLAEAGFL
jgi:RNA polymerase sigma factor (sigma-70 family)